MRQRIGRAIREQRTFVGLKQTELAEKVGVEQATVSMWERGHRAPSVDRHAAIAAALQVSPQVLFVYPDADDNAAA